MSTEQDLRGIGNRMMEDHHLNDCPKGRLMLIAADELAAKDVQIAALLSAHDEIEQVLLRKGFTRCDIPACNCGSWHHRYGLPERWEEIKDALGDAGVLDNSTGNMPLKAVGKLVEQRDSLTAEVKALDRQFCAASYIVAAQELRLADYYAQELMANEAINTLQSERDANAILTAEVARLRAMIAKIPPLREEIDRLRTLVYAAAFRLGTLGDNERAEIFRSAAKAQPCA